MSDIEILDPKTQTKTKPKVARPKMHKVILINDDYTPREFVTVVLKAVFGMGPERAYGVMMTAHQKGSCVVAVYTRDIAETKAAQGTEAGQQAGFPLMFTTEPEE
ncbi:MAG: ATP-dependent Clp protease adapter ClpS [Pseudomonadota bacterium]